MNILILHGILGKAGENWGQWLYDALTQEGHRVTMPTLPQADHPDRTQWLNAIKQNAASEDLLIVAHSLGVTSALDFIEQLSRPIDGLVSVSGFSQDYGLELNSYFLKERKIDFAKVNKNLKHVSVLYGDNDPYVTQEALGALASSLGVEATVFANGGHLNSAAGYTEFPELLKVINSIV